MHLFTLQFAHTVDVASAGATADSAPAVRLFMRCAMGGHGSMHTECVIVHFYLFSYFLYIAVFTHMYVR